MGILKDWFERNIVADDPYYPTEAEALQIDLMPPPKPRLVSVNRAPKREEWDAWRDNPVTQFVMAALVRNAAECAEAWNQASWVGGAADQRQLDGLRERADTLRGIAEASYDAFCETLHLEPDTDDAA